MILIVEDELVSRKALTCLLRASGYTTEAVESAEEAIDVVAAGYVPDLALVDLDLPGMSGLDFINHLERHNPTVRSVIITAANREKVERIQHDYNVRFVRKPIDFHQLLAVITEKQLPH